MSAAKAKSGKAATPDLLILAFDIIAEDGWRGFTFTDLAERSGLSLTAVREAFEGRNAVLDELSKRLDQAMLAFDAADMDGLPPKDRVFELMMSRLEAMTPFRSGLLRLMRDARADPALALMSACRLDRSMQWLQDAALIPGSRSPSPFGQLRSKLQRRLLGAVYLQTLNVWSSDDSRDLAKTMASLDKQLRRIEGLAGLGRSDKTIEPSADAA